MVNEWNKKTLFYSILTVIKTQVYLLYVFFSKLFYNIHISIFALAIKNQNCKPYKLKVELSAIKTKINKNYYYYTLIL